METSIVYKTRTVHSSVRLPADLHTFAKSRGINLSRTLATLLAAAKAEDEEYKKENGRVPATNCDPTTSQESHSKMNTEAVSDLENQNPNGECGYE